MKSSTQLRSALALRSPWFGQLGLGTQYELPDSVGNLIQNGYLKLAEDGG